MTSLGLFCKSVARYQDESCMKVVTKVPVDGAGGSEKNSDFGEDTFENSDESILMQQHPETPDAAYVNIKLWAMNIKKWDLFERIANILRAAHTQEDTLLMILESIQEVIVGKLLSPHNSRANPTMPKLQTAEKPSSQKEEFLEVITKNGRMNSNKLMNFACHDGNEKGDKGKSSATSQQTQCQNTNTTDASYQQAQGNHEMAPLPGGNRDDDGDEENPRKTKKDERIGGCASSEVSESDKKQNANPNNNMPEGDQPMPDRSLHYRECSDVSQGTAGYQNPQSSVSLGPREHSRPKSSSEMEDEIPLVDTNHCEDHMEALNDDNVQLEVPVNREMDHFDVNPKDENPLRLPMCNDQARGVVRESDVYRRAGARPRDTRQGDGRQIPPSGVTPGQTPVQRAPWSHEPPEHLDPSSLLVLPHRQVEGFFSQDGNADEEQIDDHDWVTAEHSSSGQCVARENDLQINQEVQASRFDELRADHNLQRPSRNHGRVIRTCFSCNMPHVTSRDQNDCCNGCGRFFCLDHFDRHECIRPWFIEVEDDRGSEDGDSGYQSDETDGDDNGRVED